MEYFVQQLINGITLGSIYGLIAIGYTMVFGIIGMVNFAHGDVFMVSSFVALITLLIVTSWLGFAGLTATFRCAPRLRLGTFACGTRFMNTASMGLEPAIGSSALIT